jgi:methyl-accepting chemotaxis protein
MSSIADSWSKIGLQIKLQILIQGFLILILLAAQHWISTRFEYQIVKSAEDRTAAVADGAINGLNTLMVTKVGSDDVISDTTARSLFIQKMGASDNVKELRIVRGKATNDEFGAGLPQEQAVDDMDREVLASGKTQFKMMRGAGGEGLLRTVMPFIAKKNFRTTNCLKCHAVDEGSVLGVASITLDIKEDLATLKTVNTWIWVGQGVLQVVMFMVVRLIVRRLLNQLGGEPQVAVDLAQRVTSGDLSGQVQIKAGDTTSLLARLNIMQGSLAEVVTNVRRSAERVENSSSEIAQGNQDLSERTESQASSLQETTASMGQLSATVQRNADNARQANEQALKASVVAIKGGEVVGQVVETMRGINDSSHRISDIISVIDGIAFQTNILALNAAVEAARAGEQGRGFAVVATEVRSLAGRSADAAKEIKSLINASVDRVEHGTALVDQAGVTMNEVVSSIKKVTDLMKEISEASSEQSAGVLEIGEAVIQMDHMTQQNSALVEQMAAAAGQLNSQAHELVQTVAVFRLPAKMAGSLG